MNLREETQIFMPQHSLRIYLFIYLFFYTTQRRRRKARRQRKTSSCGERSTRLRCAAPSRGRRSGRGSLTSPPSAANPRAVQAPPPPPPPPPARGWAQPDAAKTPRPLPRPHSRPSPRYPAGLRDALSSLIPGRRERKLCKAT